VVQRKEDILITKKVKSWSYWLIPIASIGIVTLIVQLIFSPFSADVFSFNFTLGKLWKGDSPDPVITYVDNETPKPNKLPLLEYTISDKQKRLESLSKMFQDIKPKKISKTSSASSVKAISKSEYIDINLDRIDAFVIPVTQAFTQRFINLSKQETLLPGIKDLEPSKFRFGFSFTPCLNHRKLRYLDWSATGSRLTESTAYSFGQTERYRNGYDKPILGFSVGVDVYYNKSDKLYFQTGFYYSSMGEQLYVARTNEGQSLPTRNENTTFANMNPAFQSPEMTSSESKEVIPFTNYYGYFEIPLLANYKIPSGNSIQFEIQTGLTYSYLDHADAVVYDFDTDNYFWIPTSEFELFTKHNVNVIGGVSVGTLLSPKVEIFLNPQYKYALRSTYSKAYPVNQNQYSFGMRMGLKMNLD
jgi:hypothetical protein